MYLLKPFEVYVSLAASLLVCGSLRTASLFINCTQLAAGILSIESIVGSLHAIGNVRQPAGASTIKYAVLHIFLWNVMLVLDPYCFPLAAEFVEGIN